VGILLSVFAIAGEDIEMLKTSISFTSPYISIDTDALKEDKEYVNNMIDTFKKYN